MFLRQRRGGRSTLRRQCETGCGGDTLAAAVAKPTSEATTLVHERAADERGQQRWRRQRAATSGATTLAAVHQLTSGGNNAGRRAPSALDDSSLEDYGPAAPPRASCRAMGLNCPHGWKWLSGVRRMAVNGLGGALGIAGNSIGICTIPMHLNRFPTSLRRRLSEQR